MTLQILLYLETACIVLFIVIGEGGILEFMIIKFWGARKQPSSLEIRLHLKFQLVLSIAKSGWVCQGFVA